MTSTLICIMVYNTHTNFEGRTNMETDIHTKKRGGGYHVNYSVIRRPLLS